MVKVELEKGYSNSDVVATGGRSDHLESSFVNTGMTCYRSRLVCRSLESKCKEIKVTFHEFYLGYLNNNITDKYSKGNREDDKLFF